MSYWAMQEPIIISSGESSAGQAHLYRAKNRPGSYFSIFFGKNIWEKYLGKFLGKSFLDALEKMYFGLF